MRTKTSQSATLSTAFPSGGVGGDGSHVFDSADFDSITGDGSQGRLGAWARSLVAGSASGSELDVHSGYFELLESVDYVDGSEHGGVRGGFVSIGSDFHAASDSGEGFPAGEVGDVDEGVVPGSQDMADGEEFSGHILGSKRDYGFGVFDCFDFSGDGLLLSLGCGRGGSVGNFSHEWI